jgi:glucose-6-phosphate isomerase
MLAKKNPTTTKSWRNLRRHHKQIKDLHMRDLFARDPRRFDKFSIRFNDIMVDVSKNRITEETLKSLIALAEECELGSAIESLFTGQRINETEDRAVLHTALRNRDNTPVVIDGQDVMPEVNRVLHQMQDFSARILS